MTSIATCTRSVRGTTLAAVARSAAAVLALVLLAPQGPAAQAGETKRVKLRLRPVASVKGVDLFRAYCVQCHGKEGKGDGPLAKDLRKPPADLTRIAERNGGNFSRVGVARYIMGDRPGSVTGLDKDRNPVVTRNGVADDMPLWENHFSKLYPNTDLANPLRFDNLAQYVESIQAK